MNFVELLKEKNASPYFSRPATLGFLGDSVTNGCFEVLPALNAENREQGFDVVYDPESAYSADLRKILYTFYPHAQINIVNAGISGDNAANGLVRMDRDLLPFRPDLTVVCYGLNDSGAGDDGIARYHYALVGIIEKLKAAGSEVILMTPQPIAARVHSQLHGDELRSIAAKLAAQFADGSFDRYMQEMRRTAKETGVQLCDCYARWMTLYGCGVDITDLLANYLNHPTRPMHWLFAVSLAETIFGM